MIVEIRKIGTDQMRNLEEKKMPYMNAADVTAIEGWNRKIYVGADTGVMRASTIHPRCSVYRVVGVKHDGASIFFRYPSRSSITIEGGCEVIEVILGDFLPVLDIDADRVAHTINLVREEGLKNLFGEPLSEYWQKYIRETPKNEFWKNIFVFKKHPK